MNDQRNDVVDKMEEVMLPGFRFHPTDEELVGFYLKRKIQQRPLSIELIKQLDIYKYDPWDLPKLATLGEKEWYFYCPRDRKYRNSARPNRVTGAGFWKATGTDRPIYNSEGSKCIGLKKSLVFYKGRAAKGIKTDWMMHEFRLPSTTDSLSSKRYIDKNIPANDAWAICRIFKKTNSAAQRALSHSWVSPVFETISDMPQHVQSTSHHHHHHHQLSLDNNMMPMHPTKATTSIKFSSSMNLEKSSSSLPSFTPFDVFSYKSINQMPSTEPSQLSISNNDHLTQNYYSFSSTQTSQPSKCTTINDASSLLLNMSSSIFGDFSKASSQNMEYDLDNIGHGEEGTALVKDHTNVEDELGSMRSSSLGSSLGFPYLMSLADGSWNKSNLFWDCSSSPCPTPSDNISTNYSTTNHCNT